MRSSSLLTFSCMLLVAFAALGRAQGPSEGSPAVEASAWVDPGLEAEGLESRLALLARGPHLEGSIRGTLAQARRALERAKELDREGLSEAAQRSRRIARACLLLADRQLALSRERRASSLAEQRLERAVARAERAKEARVRAEARLAERASTERGRP